MSLRLLVVVEETFAIADRGVIVAPDVDLGDGSARSIAVEVRRPDGTTVQAEARAEVPFVNPLRLPLRPRHVLRFATLTKADLPTGTEIWITENV